MRQEDSESGRSSSRDRESIVIKRQRSDLQEDWKLLRDGCVGLYALSLMCKSLPLFFLKISSRMSVASLSLVLVGYFADLKTYQVLGSGS